MTKDDPDGITGLTRADPLSENFAARSPRFHGHPAFDAPTAQSPCPPESRAGSLVQEPAAAASIRCTLNNNARGTWKHPL